MFRLFKAAHHANKNILSTLVPRRGAGLHAVCLDAGGRYRTRLGVTCARRSHYMRLDLTHVYS